MSELKTRRCNASIQHEPHFFMHGMTSGEPGPVPMQTYICPGSIDLLARLTPPAAPLTPGQPPADHGDGSGAGGREGGEGA